MIEITKSHSIPSNDGLLHLVMHELYVGDTSEAYHCVRLQRHQVGGSIELQQGHTGRQKKLAAFVDL